MTRIKNILEETEIKIIGKKSSWQFVGKLEKDKYETMLFEKRENVFKKISPEPDVQIFIDDIYIYID